MPVSTEDLTLYGVSGGGSEGLAAIIGAASGSQRLVRIGRDYRPGLTLKEVGPSHAVLASAGQDTRLELNRFAGASEPGGGQAKASAASPAPPIARMGGMDSLDFRLGMAPRRSGGRIDGFSLKRGADLPVLRQAGLQPGDVIVAVNGQPFDSAEKLSELPREIAGSYIAEFEFERGGHRMKASLPINDRPQP